MSVASAINGVTPTTANSVDSRTRPLDAAAPRNPPGWMGPAAASPGISGIAPTSAQRAIPSPVQHIRGRDRDGDDGGPCGADRDDEGDEPPLLWLIDALGERHREWDHRQHRHEPADRDEERRPARLERPGEERDGGRHGERNGQRPECLARPAAGQEPADKHEHRHAQGDRWKRLTDPVQAVVEERRQRPFVGSAFLEIRRLDGRQVPGVLGREHVELPRVDGDERRLLGLDPDRAGDRVLPGRRGPATARRPDRWTEAGG